LTKLSYAISEIPNYPYRLEIVKRALFAVLLLAVAALAQDNSRTVNLPSSKTLTLPLPGSTQRTNSFPTAMAVSPNGNYLALLNNGYGAAESQGRQSIAILDLRTNELKDFPDPRLGPRAAQTYFLGLAWSHDGKHVYASMASISDPLGQKEGHTGNGIAVYAFADGELTPERFLKIPLQTLAAGKKSNKFWKGLPDGKAISYPAGIAAVGSGADEKLLVANNLSDNAILIDAATGKLIHSYDLSVSNHVPASYPYSVVAGEHGRAWVSLWNGSQIAEVNLNCGGFACRPTRQISLRAPKEMTEAGSHPTAMLLSPDRKQLYVTLSNTDEVAVIDVAGVKPVRYLSTRLPDQKHAGAYPNAIAQNSDRLYVANASSDAVAVFDLKSAKPQPIGFIPTEWYPTALTVRDGDLLIATGKGEGTGSNGNQVPLGTAGRRENGTPYIASLIHGSLSRVNIAAAEKSLPQLTAAVEKDNLMAGRSDRIEFTAGKNPIKHIIYIIKENRTYDQLFGDIAGADGDPSLVMYGEDITPNQHALARQFGVLDNFYDSGEVSGDGHIWSTAAITTDYTEKTWQIGYRSSERTYDSEGTVSDDVPMEQGIPDVVEPGTGFLWANLARNKKTYRHYGEFVISRWCNEIVKEQQSPLAGTPRVNGETCARSFIKKGEPLPSNVGDPKGGPSPYPWPIPILARDEATKPELRGHFDPRFPDFRLDYPDQLRADEFLNEFAGFVKARQQSKGCQYELPEFIVLRLPNDHTSGTRPENATPSAAVADNDLAVGRVVDAVSHSPYWDDTAIFILEDDAQDGADHVDAHRSIALVVSKYSPRKEGVAQAPFVDHHFYTTVNVIHTMEVLLGLPPMNNNDARAAVMAPVFTGDGTQPAFSADYRNRDNGLIYQMNTEKSPGAQESAAMDFSHADGVDTNVLNAILWRDRKGSAPMPKPVHNMCGDGGATMGGASTDSDR
jgi:DNA-binding beta-propeller fold protein YncE